MVIFKSNNVGSVLLTRVLLLSMGYGRFRKRVLLAGARTSNYCVMNEQDKTPVQFETPSVPSGSAATLPRLSLTRGEAAESLGISTETLDRLVKRGLIKPSKALSKPLFPVTELARFLRATMTL